MPSFLLRCAGATVASCVLGAVALLAAMPARGAELTVSAAASLSNAFTEMARSYEAARPADRVRLNVGASGALLQQAVHGAPVDVLATADAETLDEAERRALLKPGTRVDFARNALVVVVPADAKATPASLADLGTPAFRRIALGLPGSVPAGRYARAALEKVDLWRAVEPKTVGAQSVRQALDYVARGEVDAGFVYATDATLLRDKVRVAFVIATAEPVRYPIAVLEATRHEVAARAFVAHVRSAAGQAILARHGFTAP